MRSVSVIVLAPFALLLATAASAQSSPDPKIIYVKDDDPAMEAAKTQARRELPIFYAHLAKPTKQESGFIVKYDVIVGPDAEFMWAIDLKRDANGLTGTLVDDSVDVPDFKAGQRVRIADAQIIDWGYRAGGIMQGNYTTRVLFAQMDPAEVAEIRKGFGW